MIVIAIVSFLASLSFRKALKEKNHTESKSWMNPIIIGLGTIAITQLLHLITAYSLSSSQSALNTGSLVISILGFILYFSLLSKSWEKIKALPPIDK